MPSPSLHAPQAGAQIIRFPAVAMRVAAPTGGPCWPFGRMTMPAPKPTATATANLQHQAARVLATTARHWFGAEGS